MANVVESFWKNKKVFLTGHTGFKGAWLSIWLHKMGAKVTGYALPAPTEPSLFELAGISNLIDSQIGNINDFEKLNASIKKVNPEIVIHMAAQSLVKYSYENPLETFQTNVMGTAYLLEASRKLSSVKAVVNITSDKCYENRERFEGYKEDEAMGGYDPYSSSKGCAELVTSAYQRSFYLDTDKGLASARAGNVIGGGDWAQDRLIPDIFRAIQAGKPVSIRNPKSIRPWQYVLEPLSGYLVLAQNLFENPKKYSEGFNFGPIEGDTKSVQEIVDIVIKKWGQSASFEVDKNYNGPHEAHYLKLDVTKAESRLGWKPTWSLNQCLENTVEWFKTYSHDGGTVLELCLKQIEDFEKEQSSKL